MRAGRLDKQITIIKPTEVQSTVSGSQIITWSTFLKNRWSGIENLTGRESYRSKLVAEEYDTKFTIRYATGINSKMRVIYEGSSYFIHSVVDIEKKQLDLFCSKVST